MCQGEEIIKDDVSSYKKLAFEAGMHTMYRGLEMVEMYLNKMFVVDTFHL